MELQATGEFYIAFKNFQDKYAREAKEKTTTAKKIYHDFMQEIESAFLKNGICQHFEKTRSSFDGVKIRMSSEDDGFEFDIILVIDKHEHNLQVLVDDSRTGYAWLKINRGDRPGPELNKVLRYWNFLAYIFAGDLYVDPGKTIDIFIGELQKVVNKSPLMKGKAIFRRRGPAIQMDVYPNSGALFWGPRLYSVDLVPAFQVGGALYVSKALKKEVPKRMTWRRSSSFQEKQNLSGGARCVLRALKVVLNREPGLAPLTSYHLKTALFYEMDDEDDWSDHVLVLRFLGVLRRLELSLAYGNLPHYFHREINLLSSMSSSCQRNMHDIIKCIRSSESKLIDILKS